MLDEYEQPKRTESLTGAESTREQALRDLLCRRLGK